MSKCILSLSFIHSFIHKDIHSLFSVFRNICTVRVELLNGEIEKLKSVSFTHSLKEKLKFSKGSRAVSRFPK